MSIKDQKLQDLRLLNLITAFRKCKNKERR